MTSGPPADPARSELMRRIRRKGTATELAVAAELKARKASYRLNVRSLPGSPDFANKRRQWAIFVHGCFWHHHTGCRRATVPKSNVDFWLEKFRRNRERDASAIHALRGLGFHVGVIWECEVGDAERLSELLAEILEPRRVDVAEPVDH
jgi:DNA mismatch endonuclease (patch repair protein)